MVKSASVDVQIGGGYLIVTFTRRLVLGLGIGLIGVRDME